MDSKKTKYSFRFLTESEESKLHSDLKKKKVIYDYDIDHLKKETTLVFNESLDRTTRYWLEANGGCVIQDSEEPETIKEDIGEVTKVEALELDSLVSEIGEWIEATIEPEQIYDVLWAMAMMKDDEKVLNGIKKLREDLDSERNADIEEEPTRLEKEEGL